MIPVRRFVPLLVAAAFAALASDAPAQETGGTPAGGTGGTSAPTGHETILATPHVLLDGVVEFRGWFSRDDAGRIVDIERFDPEAGRWIAIATATVAEDGGYATSWSADVAGRFRARATLLTASETATLRAVSAPDEVAVTVYRPAVASWFGPGFYGRRTACGRRMTRTLLGVAHKRLPCGTPVALRYGGATITVPVIDRGPFVKGRAWDLTRATAKALGFEETDRIGAVAVG